MGSRASSSSEEDWLPRKEANLGYQGLFLPSHIPRYRFAGLGEEGLNDDETGGAVQRSEFFRLILASRGEHVSDFLDYDLRNRIELGHHGFGVEMVVDLREQIGSGTCAHLP